MVMTNSLRNDHTHYFRLFYIKSKEGHYTIISNLKRERNEKRKEIRETVCIHMHTWVYGFCHHHNPQLFFIKGKKTTVFPF